MGKRGYFTVIAGVFCVVLGVMIGCIIYPVSSTTVFLKKHTEDIQGYYDRQAEKLIE